jgi:hypothetical protein
MRPDDCAADRHGSTTVPGCYVRRQSAACGFATPCVN